LSFCNIDIDEKMTTTENFYTCPEDCADECKVSFSVSVCEAGSGKFKIRVTGEDLYNYSMLFEGAELSMISYGRHIGEQFTWDAGPFIRVAGSVNKIHFMPKIMKSGKVIDCSNEEIIVDDLKNC
jgi:hypothetical protein